MNVKNNTAQVAVKAAALPSTTQTEALATRQAKKTEGESMPATEQQAPSDQCHVLALQCTWDIDSIAGAVNAIADEVGARGDIAAEALLRCYGMRIATLNAQVMAYLDKDEGATAERMHKAVFGRFKSTEGAAA